MDKANVHMARPITKLPFPYRVDIIIPFHGQYAKVARLLESIMRYTFSNVYKIILVDDCSPNSAFQNSLLKVPNIVTVRTTEQMGFGGAMRVGFQKSEEQNDWLKSNKKTPHPFVVFMQSDCLVEDVNWLRSMGEALLAMDAQKVKMVSPRTDNPMGGDPRQKGEKTVRAENVILEDTGLSLYCFLCHRELFGQIGGFIKEYPYGYFEDEELAYRMRKYGYRQAIAGSGWIKHIGQATIRELWREKPDTRKIMMEDNRKKCVQDIRSLSTR